MYLHLNTYPRKYYANICCNIQLNIISLFLKSLFFPDFNRS